MSRPDDDVTIGLDQTFERVASGNSLLIDPDKCALALFITPDGTVHMKTHYGPRDTVTMLLDLAEQIADRYSQ